ncbi:MAG: putative toxin-antitoxin system toxin component, PIN family [Geminicoccales bacterium]
MRVVLDSNVFISALISAGGAPHAIHRAWRERRFLLVTSAAQIAELRRASRYPKLRAIVPARDFGALLNRLHGALVLRRLPRVELSADPDDDYLLAMAKAGGADFLVTGDAKHLLRLGKLGRTKIVAPAAFLRAIG